MSAGTPFEVRRLAGGDAAAFREIRLEGLRAHPEAFGASWEEEEARPLAWFGERVEGGAVFGGTRGRAGLLGVAGLYVPGGGKQRHRGVIWGMFVRAEARATGLGLMLVDRVLEHARGVVEEVRLTVVATNGPAVRLYERAGFVRYGVEERALKVGDAYYDEVLMGLSLGGAGVGAPRERR